MPTSSGGDVVVPIRRRSPASEQGRPLNAVIVGAGVIGLACAWRAARQGLRVRVLERDEPGAGASGVAAGMLAPVGEAGWGEDVLTQLATASAGSWPSFATELAADSGLEPGYEARGALHVALDGDETAELKRRFELMRSLEAGVQWLDRGGCRDLEPGLTPSCASGVLAPGEAAVDPGPLIGALVAAVEARGGQVISGVEAVEALIESGRLAGVVTSDGRDHRADHVVLAAGAWSGTAPWLPSKARPPVRPVKGQVLTLRGSAESPPCERIISSERVYLVPRVDGRLTVGATVEERGFDVRVTAGGAHELLREAYRALPDVSELELVDALAGLRPGTPDNVPLIGPAELDGLLLATGHHRNGILMAPLTASAIAAHLAGEPPPAPVEPAHPGRFADRAAPGLAPAPALEEPPR
jgi:glycine oxidase